MSDKFLANEIMEALDGVAAVNIEEPTKDDYKRLMARQRADMDKIKVLENDLRMALEIGVEMQRELNRKLSFKNDVQAKRIEELELCLKRIKTDIQRDMNSDDSCGAPFNEDLGEALNEINELLGDECICGETGARNCSVHQ